LVSALKASLHTLVGNQLAIRSIFGQLNRFFLKASPEGVYATLFYAELDMPTRRITYVNAGHPPPMLIRSDGNTEFLKSGGIPIGLFGKARFLEGFAEMEPDDLLILLTDGITEATNSQGEEYGWEELREVICRSRSLACREICKAVLKDQNYFTQGEYKDDRTFIAIRAVRNSSQVLHANHEEGVFSPGKKSCQPQSKR
jgi:sigma-B regulation protein RsbU (phosphoserine phosphatase)